MWHVLSWCDYDHYIGCTNGKEGKKRVMDLFSDKLLEIEGLTPPIDSNKLDNAILWFDQILPMSPLRSII